MTVGLPRLSFVIPARDEEAVLGQTLDSIRAASEATGESFEIIVVNDASIDRTREIALEGGARLIDVALHNIGAVRNAGAREALGEFLVFLDADTLLPFETLSAAVHALSAGVAGGGAWVQLDPDTSWFQRSMAATFCFLWQRVCGWAAGCFIFCRREVFNEVGGFDEQYLAAEERFLSVALRRKGEFVLLKEPVITSARKLRLFSTPRLIWIAIRALLRGRAPLRRREGLEILYDAPREAGPASPAMEHRPATGD